MSQVFEIKVIKPDKMKTGVFKRAVDTALDNSAKIIQKSFKGTMSTFKRKFPVEIKKTKWTRLIWVDSEIYSYLNFGTKVRWALMSPDWKSKTSPRVLRPTGGRGRVVLAGRRAMQRRGLKARRGIKARRFDEEIVKRDSPKVKTVFDGQLRRATNRAF